MSNTLLALTIFCGLLLIGGFVWLMASSGQVRRRSGPDVGAEIMGQVMGDEGESPGDLNIPLAEGSFFRGTGVAVDKEARWTLARGHAHPDDHGRSCWVSRLWLAGPPGSMGKQTRRRLYCGRGILHPSADCHLIRPSLIPTIGHPCI
jgi:hypothetical protein